MSKLSQTNARTASNAKGSPFRFCLGKLFLYTYTHEYERLSCHERRRTGAMVSIPTNRACRPAHIRSFRTCRLWFGNAFVSSISVRASCDAETYDPRCPFAPGAFLDLGPCPVGRAALWTRQNSSGLLARTGHHEGYLEPESHCAAPRLAWRCRSSTGCRVSPTADRTVDRTFPR